MIWFDEGPSLGMSQAEADAPDIPRCHDANRNENINAMQAPVFLCLPGTTNARRERIVIQSPGTV